MDSFFKKILLGVGILIFLYYFLPEDNGKYPGIGRDGIEMFGDGRYIVTRGVSGIEGYRTYALFDRKGEVSTLVEGELLLYETQGEYIYAIGLIGPNGTNYDYDGKILKLETMPERIYYTKIQYEAGEIEQSTDISSFDKVTQEIFEELLKKETLHE